MPKEEQRSFCFPFRFSEAFGMVALNEIKMLLQYSCAQMAGRLGVFQ